MPLPTKSFAAVPHVNISPESIRAYRVGGDVSVAVQLGGITVYMTLADAAALRESLAVVLDAEQAVTE